MHRVRTYNSISVKGLDQFARDRYEVASEISEPEAILLRSHKLDADLPASLKAVARAGAGVNNVPVDVCTEQGVVVFNTPGANANAVKELVMAGLLLASRGIGQGISFVNQLQETDKAAMNKIVEAEKKNFKGSELHGKVLGVVGLGAIGSLVAEMGLQMGMHVVGYDPALSVEAAWRLSSDVQRMENMASLFAKADYISLHLPVLDATRDLVNDESLKNVKPGAILLNFSREEIVNAQAVLSAVQSGLLSSYISDFPTPIHIGVENIMLTPHLGASTMESEDNCAVMAASQLIDFIENGNVKNSVNFPAVNLERTEGYRLAIVNNNVPALLSKVLNLFAECNINVIDMINKSRDDIAYNLIDIADPASDELLTQLGAIEGVINVRTL